jgi:chromosome segregation ATPase
VQDNRDALIAQLQEQISTMQANQTENLGSDDSVIVDLQEQLKKAQEEVGTLTEENERLQKAYDELMVSKNELSQQLAGATQQDPPPPPPEGSSETQ